ncbi:S-adenosyl-L-methionine-dependent methyltransferases superfamily protein [Artemisia annua]|uniref:carnosine N-methyltransferase n=1 Tax=Artemisia annua TaxID=35608 RepID=A0A2U1MCU3_ARTAN|nr:S-adenosyl-L-methionine-dependent methyltransferases superfamily protein [Artemisia annua]
MSNDNNNKSAAAAVEDDDEEAIIRRKKYEESLEIQSLRRIISAYINYPEAAEEDVKRYERSFRRLPVAHKALLAHLPLKYQKLRRCITKNSNFIFDMLQAFEPPFDMSQDDEMCEHGDNSSCVHHHSDDRDPCCEPVSISGRAPSAQCSEACGGHEEKKENCCEPKSGSFPEGLECQTNTHKGGCDNAIDVSVDSDTDPNKDISCAPPESPDRLDSMPHFHVPLVDVDKVRCVIRNIVRDWAAEGQKERDQCYKPILEELKRHFPNRSEDSPPSCLVPGAGLGRLALEISCLGFKSQGNEFSYYMMICSSFILNQTQAIGEWTIHPWIHSNCNSLSDADQLRPVSIPDILPASAGITEGFSMCGGDFVEVYGDPAQVGAWDAIVTCFFLDTAHNIVEYIEIISKILKDGGVWINLGPLLYHFADMYGQEDEMSVELSLEDVKRITLHYGFELEVSHITLFMYSLVL